MEGTASIILKRMRQTSSSSLRGAGRAFRDSFCATSAGLTGGNASESPSREKEAWLSAAKKKKVAKKWRVLAAERRSFSTSGQSTVEPRAREELAHEAEDLFAHFAVLVEHELVQVRVQRLLQLRVQRQPAPQHLGEELEGALRQVGNVFRALESLVEARLRLQPVALRNGEEGRAQHGQEELADGFRDFLVLREHLRRLRQNAAEVRLVDDGALEELRAVPAEKALELELLLHELQVLQVFVLFVAHFAEQLGPRSGLLGRPQAAQVLRDHQEVLCNAVFARAGLAPPRFLRAALAALLVALAPGLEREGFLLRVEDLREQEEERLLGLPAAGNVLLQQVLEDEEVLGEVRLQLEDVDQHFRGQRAVDDVRLVGQEVREAVHGQQQQAARLHVFALVHEGRRAVQFAELEPRDEGLQFLEPPAQRWSVPPNWAPCASCACFLLRSDTASQTSRSSVGVSGCLKVGAAMRLRLKAREKART